MGETLITELLRYCKTTCRNDLSRSSRARDLPSAQIRVLKSLVALGGPRCNGGVHNLVTVMWVRGHPQRGAEPLRRVSARRCMGCLGRSPWCAPTMPRWAASARGECRWLSDWAARAGTRLGVSISWRGSARSSRTRQALSNSRGVRCRRAGADLDAEGVRDGAGGRQWVAGTATTGDPRTRGQAASSA